MNHSGFSLGDFFRACRDRGEPLVLATVTRTLGSTYRKAGAQMLLAGDGARGRAAERRLPGNGPDGTRALGAGRRAGRRRLRHAQLGRSDLGHRPGLRRRDDDPDDAARSRERLSAVRVRRGAAAAAALPAISRWSRIRPTLPIPLGAAFRSDAPAELPAGVADVLHATASLRAATTVETAGATFLIAPVELPPRLLVLGAGPDAMPLVEIAGLMNWHVTVLDHRPAYAVAERFPRAQRVALNPAGELTRELRVGALRRGGRDESSPAVGPGVSRRARRARGDSLYRTARPGAAPRAADAGARRKIAAAL